MEDIWIYKSGKFKARITRFFETYTVDYFQGRSQMFSKKFRSLKKAQEAAKTWVEESDQ